MGHARPLTPRQCRGHDPPPRHRGRALRVRPPSRRRPGERDRHEAGHPRPSIRAPTASTTSASPSTTRRRSSSSARADPRWMRATAAPASPGRSTRASACGPGSAVINLERRRRQGARRRGRLRDDLQRRRGRRHGQRGQHRGERRERRRRERLDHGVRRRTATRSTAGTGTTRSATRAVRTTSAAAAGPICSCCRRPRPSRSASTTRRTTSAARTSTRTSRTSPAPPRPTPSPARRPPTC